MERLGKIAIYLGIGIGVIMFSLLLVSILPHIIESSSRDWERAMGNSMTDEDFKALFYAEPAYTAFKEKYPDAIESYETRHRGDASLNLMMYNYTNLNEIRLDIRYDSYNQNVDTDVRCEINVIGAERSIHRNAQGDGVADFIEKIDCLNFKMPPDISPTDYSGTSNFNSRVIEVTPEMIRYD